MNKKIGLSLTAILIISILYKMVFYGTYFLPTAVALGKCQQDWTSRQSYPLLFGERKSPMKQLRFKLDDADIQLCYGAPLARNRILFGKGDSTLARFRRGRYDMHGMKDSELISYGSKWRMGANEPTRVFINKPVIIGDITLEPGRYSMYSTIRERQWEIVLNRSIFHWGADFSKTVTDQEIGSFAVSVAVDSTSYVEQLEFTYDENPGYGELTLSWGFHNALIPFRPVNKN